MGRDTLKLVDIIRSEAYRRAATESDPRGWSEEHTEEVIRQAYKEIDDAGSNQ